MIVNAVKCGCGCGAVIPAFTVHGKPRRFIKGHHLRLAEARKKHSLILKGKPKSQEHRQALARASSFWWQTLSLEQQEATRQAGRKGALLIDQEKRISALRHKLLGHPRTEEVKQKIGNGHRGKKARPESRLKMSDSRKKYYERIPEAKNILRQLRLSQKNIPNKNTSIEVALQKELTARGFMYLTHVSLLGICQPDILFPHLHLVVQADGDYWHRLPHMVKKDDRQDKALTAAGYEVLRFWESQIKENVTACVDAIQKAIEGRRNADVSF